MKTIGSLVGLTISLVSLGTPPKEYDINLKRPVKPGYAYQVKGVRRIQVLRDVDDGGKSEDVPIELTTISFKGRGTVISVDEKGEPTEEQVIVISCLKKAAHEKDAEALLKPGSVVVTKVAKGKTTFTVDGKELGPGMHVFLSPFLSVSGLGDQDMFAPEGKKKPGDSWEFNAKVAAEEFKGLKIPSKGLKGMASFIRVARLGDLECMSINANVKAKGLRLETPPDMTLVGSEFTMSFTLYLPTDPTLQRVRERNALKMTMVMKNKVKAGEKQATTTASLTVTTEMTYTPILQTR